MEGSQVPEETEEQAVLHAESGGEWMVLLKASCGYLRGIKRNRVSSSVKTLDARRRWKGLWVVWGV